MMKKILKNTYNKIYLIVTIFLFSTTLIYHLTPIKSGNKTFYLANTSTSNIIDTLQKHDYSLNWLDKIVFSLLPKPKKGWYTLKEENIHRLSFFHTIKQSKTKTFNIKVFAGESTIEVCKRLANDLHIDEGDTLHEYINYATYLEADILAGSYAIANNANAQAAILALFHETNEKLSKLLPLKKEKEVNQILTIASIIQKETNDPEEMYLVSSVIQNRLKKKMRLQMDGTLNYDEYSSKIVTSSQIKEDNSFYNTYKNSGLPPLPVSTVSIDAIEATLNPKHTKYLYFMLDKEGKHTFSTNYKTHLEHVKQFKSSL
ncbi:MAG: endolytic transglycosylase MltG [Campylobacterota bacterium]|nr:endolytic transglycosylase MltG [Campylobacterota bacterium]